MAIRDRVTIITSAGRTEQMVVTRQGSSIQQIWPRNKSESNYEARMLDKNSEPTGESIIIPSEHIVSVVTDVAPKEARKTKG